MSETPTSGAHSLSLKIIRLSKPSLSISSPCPPILPDSEPWADYARSVHLPGTPESSLRDLALSDLLVLPAHFGNIYLGETFSAFVSVNNESLDRVVDVTIKAELQTTSQRFSLVDTSLAGGGSLNQGKLPTGSPKLSLDPGKTAEFVLSHEIKELGIHILVCSVHYTVTGGPLTPGSRPEDNKKFFRKFYKFQVQNPLSVKTKVHSLVDGRVFLETQIQNIMTGPMHLDRMRFEPAELFSFVDMNSRSVVPEDRQSPAKPMSSLPLTQLSTLSRSSSVRDQNLPTEPTKSVPGSPMMSPNQDSGEIFGSYLGPQDTRQYLFLLVPKPDPSSPGTLNPLVRSTPNLGKLDIIWSTQMGQTGRLQTSQLTRKVPTSVLSEPFELSVISQPASILVEEPFTLKCRLKNHHGSESLRIKIVLDKSQMKHVLFRGLSEHALGNVPPLSFVDFDLEFFPLYSGLFKISGLKIQELISGYSKEVTALTQVLVKQEASLVQLM